MNGNCNDLINDTVENLKRLNRRKETKNSFKDCSYGSFTSHDNFSNQNVNVGIATSSCSIQQKQEQGLDINIVEDSLSSSSGSASNNNIYVRQERNWNTQDCTCAYTRINTNYSQCCTHTNTMGVSKKIPNVKSLSHLTNSTVSSHSISTCTFNSMDNININIKIQDESQQQQQQQGQGHNIIKYLFFQISFLFSSTPFSVVQVVISSIIWFTAYMLMAIVGETTAFMHFQRYNGPQAYTTTNPLPDYGYDIIPYFCPTIKVPLLSESNCQDITLILLYTFILGGCLYRYFFHYPDSYHYLELLPTSTYHNQLEHVAEDEESLSSMEMSDVINNEPEPEHEHEHEHKMIKFWSKYDSPIDVSNEKQLLHTTTPNTTILNTAALHCHRKKLSVQTLKSLSTQCQSPPRIIFQQLLHLNTLLFIARTTIVSLTGLPNPNPRCINVQHDIPTYSEAFAFVVGRGFPPRGCGDLIFSGHVGCILICMLILTKHNFLKNSFVCIITWLIAVMGILSTISCRSHYSVDVVLSFYFVHGIKEFYYARINGVIDGGILGKVIRWLEKSFHSNC